MSCNCKPGAHHTPAPVPRAARRPPVVTVGFGGRSASVDLTKLYSVSLRGKRAVSLVDVWVAGGHAADLPDLTFDFVADDGFQSSRAAPLLASDLFARGHIEIVSRDLVWDAQLLVPCPFRVRHVSAILARGMDARLVASR